MINILVFVKFPEKLFDNTNMTRRFLIKRRFADLFGEAFGVVTIDSRADRTQSYGIILQHSLCKTKHSRIEMFCVKPGECVFGIRNQKHIFRY